MKLLYSFVRQSVFKAPAFIDHSLEQPSQTFVIQRPVVPTLYVADHLPLSLRVENLQVASPLDFGDLDCTMCTFIQELHELLIDLIDSRTPVFEGHSAPPLI